MLVYLSEKQSREKFSMNYSTHQAVVIGDIADCWHLCSQFTLKQMLVSYISADFYWAFHR